MPVKAKGKKTKKAASKKAAEKKSSGRKKANKKAAGKPAPKKVSQKSGRSAARPAARITPLPEKNFVIEPGAPRGYIPSVEEPAANEEAIGTVTHYYSHLGVAVIQINQSILKIGSRIHVTGHTTDFSQTVDSMEYEHQHVDEASAGQSVGIKVIDQAREHDIVFLVK